MPPTPWQIKEQGKQEMIRSNIIASVGRTVLLSSAVMLAAHGTGHAQEAEIKAAIAANHAAIESLDVTKVDPLWVHDATVTLINPASKSISVGWDAVRKAWAAQSDYLAALKITQVDGPYIQVKGDIAWETGVALSAGKLKSGADFSRRVVEFDVFEKRDGKWLLVSHSATRLPE